jgi:hypothetical protein
MAATAAVPQKVRYDVVPPGQVMQDQVAYLTGEAMHSAWHIIASRKLAGKNMGKTPAYQWYLSFYAPDGEDGGKLVYRLPNKDGELLSRVTKAHGADLYFPQQDVKIIGAGEFEQSGVQDVVVWDHQAGADCGADDVTVFGANMKGQIEQRVHVENGCSLSAKIVKRGDLSAVQLNGPYYSPKAALCCPTKPKASALLAYSRGTWSVRPNYYIISASLAAHR